MRRLVLGTVLSIAFVVTGVSATAVGRDPGECPRDTKLIGAVEISAVDSSDTWWGITKAGFIDAGYDTPAEMVALMNSFFGTTHTTLAPLIDLLLEPVRTFDLNGNNYICAFSLRGARKWIGDPDYTHYTVGTSDDKIR
jgi:hypothetical protein